MRTCEDLYDFVRVRRDSGEHRLLACSRRQPADNSQGLQGDLTASVRRAFRQAAEKDRLAACAPQNAGSTDHRSLIITTASAEAAALGVASALD
jgi:hypothetical protein